MMKYKIVVIGPAGSGKTTLLEMIWNGTPWDKITTTPTTSYNFIDKPLKLGNITISALDLGGQVTLLEQWLDKNHPFKCFEAASAVLILFDLSREYRAWRQDVKNPVSRDRFYKRVDGCKDLLLRIVSRIADPEVKITILFNKWDLMEDQQLREYLRREFTKFIEDKLANKVTFKGIYFTSNKLERYSPKIAVRAVLPHRLAIEKIFENFARIYTDLKAEHVYFSMLDENLLEIESYQFPKDNDYVPLVQSFLKSIYHSYHVPDTYRSMCSKNDDHGITFTKATCQITNQTRSYTAQLIQLNEESSLFVLSDINDPFLMSILTERIQETMLIKEFIYK
ncbi:MAG: hypothetical protein EAX96_05835 [Candidatus Lokiarchaeota archaeon]|nr:hypothetical protein [Candidatus Lokiarchaeota archaeon]